MAPPLKPYRVHILLPGVPAESCDFKFSYLQAANLHAAINRALKQVFERKREISWKPVTPLGPTRIVIVAECMKQEER